MSSKKLQDIEVKYEICNMYAAQKCMKKKRYFRFVQRKKIAKTWSDDAIYVIIV